MVRYVEIPAVDIHACKVSTPFPLSFYSKANLSLSLSLSLCSLPRLDFHPTYPPGIQWSFNGPSGEFPFPLGNSIRLTHLQIGLLGAIVQASAGHQSEIYEKVEQAGEALVATISECVDSIDEVRSFHPPFLVLRGFADCCFID
jgi:hypothetical protein